MAFLIAAEPFAVFSQEQPYRVYDLESGLEEGFDNYDAAYAFFQENTDAYENLVLSENGSVLRMEYGIVEFKTDEACSLVLQYESLDKGQIDYLNGCYGIDALYLDTTYDKEVSFLIGGDHGRIALQDVILHPLGELKTRISSYALKDGKLTHNIMTQFDCDFFTRSLSLDDALPFMEEERDYYCFDGHYFYDDLRVLTDDERQNTHEHSLNEKSYYNYYQYLPYRSYSAYTPEEMRDYLTETLGIDGRLCHYSDLNGDGAADEVNRSQLFGEEGEFFACQQAYGSNALMLLSCALNESAYGKSRSCFADNNLFSSTAFENDEQRENDRYGTVADSIYAFSRYFISSRYSNIRRSDYRGTFFGNKAAGINVNYSIDPYYGEKNASLYYELDDALGRKDRDRYALAIVKGKDRLAFYSDSALEKHLFSLYDISELSLIVLQEGDEYCKVRIDPSFSDDFLYDPMRSIAYIAKEHVAILVNEDSIGEEAFTLRHVDFDGGMWHMLSSADLPLREGEKPAMSLYKQGYEFVEFDQDDKAVYRKITSLDLVGSIRKNLRTGEEIDLRGLYLKMTYEDGRMKSIPLNSDMIEGYDADEEGDQTLLIRYGEKSREEKIVRLKKLQENYETMKEAVEKGDGEKAKTLIGQFDYPFSFADIRRLDYPLMQKNQRNYVIQDRTERHDLSISGLDLCLDDKRSLSIYGDTYYVIVEDIGKDSQERIFDVADGYGFTKEEGIDIRFRFNYQDIELKGPVIVQMDLADKKSDMIYSVYHLNKDGDVIKCRTTQSQNYIQFMISESGPYLVLSLPSVNEYDIKDMKEDLSYENMGIDRHKANFELMGTIVISLMGIIGVISYYIVYNEREKLWKDFRRSLREAGTVQEEKLKS